MTPQDLLCKLAAQYVGITEQGQNAGPQVIEFQRSVNPKPNGEPWCLDFVQFCIQKVDQQMKTKTIIPLTEGCMDLWKRVDPRAKLKLPEPGCVVIWEHFVNGAPTVHGHSGIVIDIPNEKLIQTIEGNTGPSPGVDREGDGVYEKLRCMNLTLGSMRVKGFIRPWLSDVPQPSGG